MDPEFYMSIKNQMMANNGVLALHGTSYRHYYNSLIGKQAEMDLPIVVGINSLRALVCKQQRDNLDSNWKSYSLSVGEHQQLASFQFRIGGTLYPNTKISTLLQDVSIVGGGGKTYNVGEHFHELKKCLGSVHNFKQGSFLNKDTMGLGYNSGTTALQPTSTYYVNDDEFGILPDARCQALHMIRSSLRTWQFAVGILYVKLYSLLW